MKKILMFLLLGIFLISFTSALEPTTHRLNDKYEFIVTCNDIGFCDSSTECVINIESPNNTKIVMNQNMSYQISYFNYSITPDEIGIYGITGNCLDGELSAPIDFELDVTFSGKANNIWAFIISLIVTILLLIGTIWLNRTYDKEARKSMYKKIVVGFFEAKEKNKILDFGSMILFLIGYGFLEMTFVLYYLDIMLILFVFKDLVVTYGINGLSATLPSLLVAWLWGLIVVAAYWMLKLTTIALGVIKDITDGMRMGFEQ